MLFNVVEIIGSLSLVAPLFLVSLKKARLQDANFLYKLNITLAHVIIITGVRPEDKQALASESRSC